MQIVGDDPVGVDGQFLDVVVLGVDVAAAQAIGACVFTCALFGLIHAVNLITGQSLGETIAQMILDVILGMSFYLLRRMSGALTAPIVAHGLWNFSLYLHASVP